MEVTIELDSERVHREVVNQLVARLSSEAKEHVRKSINLVFIEDLRRRVRAELDEIFKDLVLPDGRTFRKYVEELITEPAREKYDERPMLRRLIEDRLWKESAALFTQVVEPHMEDFKKKLLENIALKMRP